MKQLTLQEQYNLLNEGKGNKNTFMKSALRQFPNLFNNLTDYNTAVSVLKQKQIISEGAGGVVTAGNPFMNWEKFLAEEAKAEEKKTTKEVEDMETAGFDYKDPKNIDNVYGEAFLQGYYTEMKDPKNAEKTVDELKEIVAKNLAKDRLHYVKDGQFGVKGVGYTDDLPGLKVSDKEIKGKYASSGMEEVKLKETMIKLTDLISESYSEFQRDDKGRKDVDAKDKGEQDAFGAGVEKGEEIEKKKVAKKKPKKESVETKLAEIEKEGKIVTMEAQIEAIDELIGSKTTRLSMIDEDENLAELVDKKKRKDMEKEIKELQKRRAKMEKVYEKLSGKAYVKQEIVDEVEVSEEYED